MKPLVSEIHDQGALQDLGRASAQIIHDLKNQLNGLKLYATFLRKRMAKGDRPADEKETVAKLIDGLERATTDMAVLLRFSQPIELNRRPNVNLIKMATDASRVNGEGSVRLSPKTASLEGDFDPALIDEAIRAITESALNMRRKNSTAPLELRLMREDSGSGQEAVIEWRGLQSPTTDPFRSFAGSKGLKMALAAKIIEAHNGRASYSGDAIQMHLPLKSQE
jgi:signal transduction histidine kinase